MCVLILTSATDEEKSLRKKELVAHHMGSKWQSRNSNPDGSDSKVYTHHEI